jgi:ribosomal protein L11 methyltransferase
VTGYLVKDDRAERYQSFLEERLAILKTDSGLDYRIEYGEIDEEDWAESWKAYFWPERVGKKLVVKPTWRSFEQRPDDIVIELDPGMAFGTGTHPTTALCLEMIEDHSTPRFSFLDIGTGSGILMLAAAKLGAKRLIGIDNDPVAVEVATQNLLKNHVEKKRFTILQNNLLEKVTGTFDMIVANILSPVIVELADHLKPFLKPDGLFIGSGIIEESKERVIEKIISVGFEIGEIKTRDGWVAISARLHGNKD